LKERKKERKDMLLWYDFFFSYVLYDKRFGPLEASKYNFVIIFSFTYSYYKTHLTRSSLFHYRMKCIPVFNFFIFLSSPKPVFRNLFSYAAHHNLPKRHDSTPQNFASRKGDTNYIWPQICFYI
jgi:hypothetical protein